MFTVHLTQSAVVLELSKPKKIVIEPGLYFKIPVIQKVRYFSKQLLDNDSPPTEVLTRDKKNLLIDNFSLYRITDPLKFLETVRTENGARARLDDIVYSELRVEIGTHDLHEVVTTTRGAIMEKVTKEANKKAAEYGIQMDEVRMKRIDLPPKLPTRFTTECVLNDNGLQWNTVQKGKKSPPKFELRQTKKKQSLLPRLTSRNKPFEVKGTGNQQRFMLNPSTRIPNSTTSSVPWKLTKNL